MALNCSLTLADRAERRAEPAQSLSHSGHTHGSCRPYARPSSNSCFGYTPLRQTHLVAGQSVRPPAIPLLRNAELDTLALRQGDPRLLAADDEDVRLTGGKLVVDRVLNVDDVETTVMTLTVSDDTDATHVATTGGHSDHTSVEADEVGDFAWQEGGVSDGLWSGLGVRGWVVWCGLTGREIDLDGIIDLDRWIWEANAMSNTISIHLSNQSMVQRLKDATHSVRGIMGNSLTCEHHA